MDQSEPNKMSGSDQPLGEEGLLKFQDPRHRQIKDALEKIDAQFGNRIAQIYDGMMIAFNSRNPERMAIVCHLARELSAILPRYLPSLPVKAEGLSEDELKKKLASLVALLNKEGIENDLKVAQAKEFTEGLVVSFAEKTNHRKQLQGIISQHTQLGQRPSYLNNAFLEEWIKIHKFFHHHAHHPDLRSKTNSAIPEKDFQRNITVLNEILYRLLVPEPFFSVLKEIDKLLLIENPTAQDVDSLARLITEGEHRRYFFEKCNNPNWLSLLSGKGAFAHPQEALKENGYVRFLLWPESQYLARIADRKPEEVFKIVEAVTTDNQSVFDDFADAAFNSPPETAAKYVSLIIKKKWLQNPYNLRLPDKIAKLMQKLAKAGKNMEAISLAKALFDVRIIEPIKTSDNAADPLYLIRPDAKAYVDEWRLGEIMKNQLPDLALNSPVELFEVFSSKLRKALELEGRNNREDGFYEYSHIWRPNLMQSRNKREDAKNILLDGMIDLIEKYAADSSVLKQFSESLNKHPQTLFKRIQMMIYGFKPDEFIKESEEILTNEKIIIANNLHREYLPLLGKVFGKISEAGKESILQLIEKGPGFVKPDYLSDEQFANQLPIWQMRYFSEIEEYLPEPYLQKYKEMVSRFGKQKEDDGEVKISDGGKSPIAPKELAELDPEKTIEYFSTYEDPEDFLEGHSSGGLGMAFAGITKENPEKYVSKSALFLDPKVRPIFVYHFLNGLKDALKKEKCFAWEPVIDLCYEITKKSTAELAKPASNREQDWRSVYFAIVDLLGEALGNKKCEIPIEQRDKIWNILSTLSEHPEPTPEDEKRDGQGGLDPMTLSINTVRGEAMQAVVNYGLWIARNQKEADKQAVKMPPEMEALLNKHLDPKFDPSLAIRSVYGWRLPNIFYLNRKWVEDNKEKIFPSQAEDQPLLLAALEGYSANSVYYDIFDVLKDVYKKAIPLFGTAEKKHGYRASDIDERLPQHLMVTYAHDQKHDDLIEYFFSTAPAKARAQAISFIGHMILKELPGYQDKEEVTKRMLQLWDARLNKPASNVETEELQEFGWWFARSPFAHEETLDRTIKTLKLTKGIIDVPYEIVEALGGYAPQYPLETITILDLLARADREFNDFSYKKEEYRAILKSIKGSGNQEAIKIADSLINFIGTKGVIDFGELLN